MNRITKLKGPPRFPIGKVGISAVDMVGALSHIHDVASSGQSAYICVANVRTTVLAQKYEAFCRVQNESFLTVPDGMPLVWYAKIGGVNAVGRVAGPDLMEQILSISNEYGYSHYFYGSTEDVLAGMKRKVLSQFRGLDIRGMVSPPFRPLTDEEKVATAEAINRAKPTFVWVGLSAPKQEFWMKDMIDKIKSSILVGVGAAFPYTAGEIRRPPHLVREIGIEWLFRCIQMPITARRFIVPFFYFSVILLGRCSQSIRGKRVQLSKE